MGYLIRKYGATIDALLAAEVVTAAGESVIADANNHADLFWALRGGGGNFGVVTRLLFRLEKLPEFSGGPLFMPATPEVLAGFVAEAEMAPDELSAIVLVMPAPPLPFLPPQVHGQLVILAAMAFAGPAEAAQRALAPFRALAKPIADLVGPAPYSSLYQLAPAEGDHSSATIRSRFISRFGVEEARQMIEDVARGEAPIKAGQVRALGGAFARVPVDATAFAHRKARFMTTYLAIHEGDPADSAAYDLWATEANNALKQSDTDGMYVNFLAETGKDALNRAYPEATLKRLQAVKAKYDPDNLFRGNWNVTPKA
jgi:FAD/FMN-containing dehydrogenase